MKLIYPKIALLICCLFININFIYAQCNYSQSLTNPNLVTNGNFSSGNSGFTSGYSYSTINPLGEASYVITNNASNVHFAFSGVDHTTGTGNFMVLNGSSTPTNVWNQSVSVIPNTFYNFSAWCKNIVTKPAYAGAPIATVELWINGVKISSNMALPDYPDVWKLLDTSWFSGSVTTANLSIRNIATALHGNDFAIDDVAFKACCPPAGSAQNLNACFGTSTQLNGTATGSFSWSPTAGLSNPAILNPTFTATNNTQYVLSKTLANCIVYDTFKINVQNCCFNCSTLPGTIGNGLVACYPFTGNANDESGNGNHGTVFNATLTTDRFNKPNRAYFFNGTNAYITAPNSTSLSSPIAAVTIAFWADIQGWVLQNGENYASVISKSNSTANCAYRFSLTPTGVSIIHNGSIWPYYPGGMSNVQNNWNHYVVTTNGNILKVYKDGVLLGTSSTPSNFTFDNSNPLQIGRDFPGILDYYRGKIDDIRLYNRALSDSEVSQLFLFSSTENLPTANAGTDIQICGNDSFQLNGTGFGLPSWLPAAPLANANLSNTRGRVNGNTSFILTRSIGSCVARDTALVQPVVLFASAGPDLFICKRQSVVVNGMGNGTQSSWLPIKNILNNLSATPTVNPDTTTTYILTVSNGSCLRRDTMTVFVNPLDVNILTKDTIFCKGDTIQLRATSTGPNYIWSPNTQMVQFASLNPKVFPAESKKYYIELSDGICRIKDSVLLTLTDLIITTSGDTVICEGDTISIYVLSPGASFKWNPAIGLFDNTASNPGAFPLNTTKYLVEANKGNCKANDSITILVDKMPTVDAGPDVRYCFGESAQLSGAVTTGANYVWTPAIDLSDTRILNPFAMGQIARQYILMANQGKCANSDTVLATPNPLVTAAFTFSPNHATYPALVQFTNQSTHAKFYEWWFDDNGAQSYLPDPSHRFVMPRIYNVWLKVSDSLGCSDSTTSEVNVIDEAHLHVPNVFSPNSNGLNDRFEAVYTLSSFEFVSYEIYNRWGDLVYRTKMPGGAWWDGTYNNAPCPDGVYFFMVKARALNGKAYNLHGTVTLLR
jgi:gliding motility-associated-like protein